MSDLKGLLNGRELRELIKLVPVECEKDMALLELVCKTAMSQDVSDIAIEVKIDWMAIRRGCIDEKPVSSNCDNLKYFIQICVTGDRLKNLENVFSIVD